MKINPYLIFNGDCAAAFRFYAQCLQGTLEVMMTFGESPARDHVPADCHDRVMHTRLVVGDQAIMGSDTTPDRPYSGIQGCSISLNVDSIAEAERVFAALADQGTVHMPLEATFWAARFGMLVDRFGASWMVNCEKDQ
ncbi:VOC family protein [Pseudomonas chlororaphis]|uniref:VOC family protein n=1 Tax=Pseudomonas chlororaphis TaxID=587753 RepID=UPI001E3CD556|nr:VOC family protein [Pseudomonas chlororaphis]MCB2256206.1 VOC family protein [Pseudomonas chlororaphis]